MQLLIKYPKAKAQKAIQKKPAVVRAASLQSLKKFIGKGGFREDEGEFCARSYHFGHRDTVKQ